MWLRKNIFPHFSLITIDLYEFQLTYMSSNWLSLVPIDFTQSTWFTRSKVNWKIFSHFCWKFFPIHFESPKHFTQLHMIRPLMYAIFINIFVLRECVFADCSVSWTMTPNWNWSSCWTVEFQTCRRAKNDIFYYEKG